MTEEKIVPVAQEIEEESAGKSVGVSEEESENISIQPEESFPSFPSPIPSEPRKEKKTVTFGLVCARELYSDTFMPIIDDFYPDFVVECKGVEEENFFVSDDLICSFQEERKIKNNMCGQQAKAQWRWQSKCTE